LSSSNSLATHEPSRLEKRGYQPRTPRKAINELNGVQKLFLEYVVHGCSKPDLCDQINVEPHTPLTIEQAADLTRLRRRFARWLFEQPAFRREYGKAVQSIKTGAHVEAVRKQIEIMRHVGEGSAADKAIALKATQALLDSGEGKGGTSVNIQLNNSVTLNAGVVIRLPSDAATTPLELQANNGKQLTQPVLPHSAEQDDVITLDPNAAEAMTRNWPSIGGGNE